MRWYGHLNLTLSRPLDVNYVLEQCQGHGHLSKYLISGLSFQFFSCLYEKKNFKVFSKKKKSLDISLQHKNRASNKFSKKKLLYLAENRAGAERVNMGAMYISIPGLQGVVLLGVIHLSHCPAAH